MHKEHNFIALAITVFLFASPLKLESTEDQEIIINSLDAQIIESLDEDSLRLTGKVVVKTDMMELWSDSAIFNRSSKILLLEGNVKALSKNLDIKADIVKTNLLERTFLLSNAKYSFLNRAFGEAKKIEIKSNEEIELLNVSLTSCEIENQSWDLNAEAILILNDKRNVIVRNIELEMNKIPIFYFPYVRTAIGTEKFSGFLTPSVKQGKDGLDLSLPYFIDLAANYDLTISPRFIEERGSGFSAEGRYLTKNSDGIIKVANFFKDRKFENLTGITGNRWSGKWDNTSQLSPNLLLRISSEHVSDNLFYEDLNDDILGTQQKDYLSRNIKIYWSNKNIRLKGELNKYENLNPFSSNNYDTEPSFDLNFRKKINYLDLRLDANYSKFKFNDSFNPFNKSNNIKRVSITPSVGIDRLGTSSLSTFRVGRTKGNHDDNTSNLDNSRNWAEISHKVYLDKYSENQFRSLNPMLKIIWIDGKNSTIESIDSRLLNLDFESIHRRNLYSGDDFFLENNRIILGFEHHFINQVTGNESSVSVAKAFFSNKDFVRNQEKKLSSSIVSAFNLEITSNFEIKGSVEIDSDLEDMLAGSLSVKFNKGPKKNIEVRSVYKREVLDLDSYLWQDRYLPINQFEVISQWEISDNILLFSKVLRDAQSNASKDLTFGFEYSNCCLKAGLMKRKWIDQDYYSLVTNQSIGINHGLDNLHFEQERDNVYFFFELVELGRFGKEISEVLSSKYFQ